MKALVFHDVGDIRLEDVPEPEIQKPTDAIVRLTNTTICGTDLHMVRGTIPGMETGTILGHEGVGIVEKIGPEVRNLSPGDRVVICSTIACGYCVYCRAGYFAKCDNANPRGKRAGTAYFGGPKSSGPFHGLQAEKARIPFANIGTVKLPKVLTDAQAILLSDVFPTGYFGAELAEIHKGDTIAVFGCGPVGLFAVLSAQLMGAGRVLAVDCIPSRLATAREMGAEIISFDEDDPIEVILKLTGGIGVDRVIDAVGIDAQGPGRGPAAIKTSEAVEQYRNEVRQAAPRTNIQGENWKPGNAPSQVLGWAVECLAKAGTFSIIGVYPSQFTSFPIGAATDKNLTVNMGACHHRKYVPMLIELIESGSVDLPNIITQVKSFGSVIEAYREFDLRKPEWTKVQLILSEEEH